LFSSNDFGYVVNEGDLVHIPGTIGAFRGLTQIDPDTIILVSSGNPLAIPAVITSLDETTESELVRFNDAYLVDPSQWPTASGSANVDVTNGTDTLLVRIDSDTDIDGSPAPTDTFDVIGLGGQFTFASPALDGYQLLPRSLADFIPQMTTPSLPVYPIGLVTDDANNDGEGDSLGVACELRGVVHGIDMQGGSSVSFTIIDQTGGIGLFSGNDFGYVVNEGDSVHIPGTIGAFRGLTQIAPDTIILVSSGNALATPTVITSLDETTESELVRFNDAYLVDPSQWPTTSGSANVDVTNGTDTLLVRIDSDTDIDGSPAPTDTFDVIGLGGQFTFDTPPLNGYQLLPRSLADFILQGSTGLPVYPIGLVTDDANTDGEGDSVGVACEIRGVVYGIDIQGGSNISFTIIDQTGGIGLFSGNDFGYVVNEGDSVHIPGTIGAFRGLTQIAPDTIILVSSGNALVTPAVITSLDETTESELVRFNNAYLVDPSQWPAAGSSANVDVTNGTDTLLVRIDSDTDIDGSPAPSGFFDVIGLGGQFTFDVPPLNGYQLLPRSLADFIALPSPGIAFNPAMGVAGEGDGSFDFAVELPGSFPDTVEVDVVLDVAASTATAGADFMWMDTTLTFAPGVTSLPLSLMLTDDMMVEVDETVVLNLSTATGLTLGDSVLTLTIRDNDFPTYPIGLVTADDDGDGIADSLGVQCELRGLVYGVNLSSSASQFFMRDSTDGIQVFSFDYDAYPVTEGDSIHVIGFIDSFRGLAEIVPDTIIFISAGNTLPEPVLVDQLDETTENEFVSLTCVKLLNPGDWPTDGSNANLDFTNYVDTFTVRVDKETEIDGSPVPTGWMTVTGMGAQFSFATPPLDGYQIFPRFNSDFEMLPDPMVGFAAATATVGEADGMVSFQVDQTDGNPDTTMVTLTFDAASSTATLGDDFLWNDTTIMLTGCGVADSVSLMLDIVDDLLVEGNETVVVAISSVTNNAILTTDTLTLTIEDNDTENIGDRLAADAVSLYPNPATRELVLETDLMLDEVRILSLHGQEVVRFTQLTGLNRFDISSLPAGLYLLEARTANGRWVQKWVKE
jgi:DNA/RNA endonuclease YhcR with UshA esterase domain